MRKHMQEEMQKVGHSVLRCDAHSCYVRCSPHSLSRLPFTRPSFSMPHPVIPLVHTQPLTSHLSPLTSHT